MKCSLVNYPTVPMIFEVAVSSLADTDLKAHTTSDAACSAGGNRKRDAFAVVRDIMIEALHIDFSKVPQLCPRKIDKGMSCTCAGTLVLFCRKASHMIFERAQWSCASSSFDQC